MSIEKKHFIKSLTRNKVLFNAVKTYTSYGLSIITKKSIVWGLPPIIMIEPTNYCNLKCPLCPSGNGSMKRPRGFMELDLFKKIIDEIKQTASMIILWNQGEPFLHKNIIEMISYCNQNRIFTMTSSNANVIPNEDELVKSGLDLLIVSLDGASQETYNQYRINGNIEKVIENTKKIVAAKKKLKSQTPVIKWQFIVMKHNENEIEKIKKLGKKIGVDSITLKTVQIYQKSDIDNFLPTNPKYRRYKVEDGQFTLKKKISNRCRRIFTQPVINWDGQMAICCFDKDNIFRIGNVKEKSIKDLWKSDNLNRVRQLILKDRKQIPICLNCGEGIKLSIKKNNN